jgi:hypothetical protein
VYAALVVGAALLLWPIGVAAFVTARQRARSVEEAGAVASRPSPHVVWTVAIVVQILWIGLFVAFAAANGSSGSDEVATGADAAQQVTIAPLVEPPTTALDRCGALSVISPDVHGCNLSGQDMAGLDLGGHNLGDTYMVGANLAGANLIGVSFVGANLTNADLTGANLTGADLTGATLAFTKFGQANMRGANLSNTDLAYADLRGADLTSARLDGADWSYTLCPDGAVRSLPCSQAAVPLGASTLRRVAVATTPGTIVPACIPSAGWHDDVVQESAGANPSEVARQTNPW